MNHANCGIVDICKMQLFLYFQYYVLSAHQFPSTNIQASSMRANATLMVYLLTWDYIKFHETCHQDVIIITINVILIILKGNGTVPSVFV